MKVSDIMQKRIDSVTSNTPLLEVAELIFGRNINGVPVCEGKKVVGFITERDILQQFFPSVQEVMEDFSHARDFELMEGKIDEIFSLPVSKIMSHNPITITADTPLLRAQSLMQVRKVGRLPVVDSRGNLIGIVSKGDIFRAIVGEKLPLGEEEEFYNWLARHYDIIIDWEKRLSQEIPDLTLLFKKEKAKKILDVASSTGEHVLALTKKKFEVFGIETSSLMHKLAEDKKMRLNKNIRQRAKFFVGNYREIIQELPGNLDVALFMGNALSHVMHAYKNILKDVTSILNPNKSLLIFQIINFEKIFRLKSGFRNFSIKKTNLAYEKQHAFLGFYEKGKGKTVIDTWAIFDFTGNKWALDGLNTTPILYIGQKEITSILKGLGFSKISFYGSSFYGHLFREPFKPLESDWLNVVAKR